MARYKAIDSSLSFLAVSLDKRLLPGGFEHAVHRCSTSNSTGLC